MARGVTAGAGAAGGGGAAAAGVAGGAPAGAGQAVGGAAGAGAAAGAAEEEFWKMYEMLSETLKQMENGYWTQQSIESIKKRVAKKLRRQLAMIEGNLRGGSGQSDCIFTKDDIQTLKQCHLIGASLLLVQVTTWSCGAKQKLVPEVHGCKRVFTVAAGARTRCDLLCLGPEAARFSVVTQGVRGAWVSLKLSPGPRVARTEVLKMTEVTSRMLLQVQGGEADSALEVEVRVLESMTGGRDQDDSSCDSDSACQVWSLPLCRLARLVQVRARVVMRCCRGWLGD